MTADDLRAAANDTVSGAKDATTKVGEVASEAGAAVAEKTNDAVDRVSDAAGSAYHEAKGRMPDDAVEAGKRAYAQGSERIGRQVARQPIEALLLAGAIGYLVGWAANRS